MQQYEIHDYSNEALEATVTTHRLRSDSSARSMAGRVAKRNGGPVDLAYAGGADWNERYITTAMPSEFHTSGYCFERNV